MSERTRTVSFDGSIKVPEDELESFIDELDDLLSKEAVMDEQRNSLEYYFTWDA